MRCNLSFCKSAWWPHCHRCHGQNVNIPTQHTLLTQDAAGGLMPPLCLLALPFIRALLSHPLILFPVILCHSFQQWNLKPQRLGSMQRQ